MRVERQDLSSLEVREPVDLILSTATFHWINDHDRLFGRLALALKPHGRLAAQCGGEGNISRATRAVGEAMREEPFRPYFEGWQDDKHYADPPSTKARLEAAGFEDVEAWLHEEEVPFDTAEELSRYLGAIVLGGHVARLPEELRGPFTMGVAEKMVAVDGKPVLDYVRLNIQARKSA